MSSEWLSSITQEVMGHRGNGLQELSPSCMKICYLQFFEVVGNRKVKTGNA
jgi:hypothetical protein